MMDAAREGMIITLACSGCRRATHYWAADLVTVLGPRHDVTVPPWPCDRCRTKEFVSVRWNVPGPSTLQSLTVRRPVKQISRWVWRDEKA